MNRCRFAMVIAILVALFMEPSVWGAVSDRVPLRVLYLSRDNNPARTASFTEFLNLNFASCRTEARSDFRMEFTKDIDVVVLDWSQDERLSNKVDSPIGQLEEWTHPIVLLGSAGLLLSKPWRVIGDAG